MKVIIKFLTSVVVISLFTACDDAIQIKLDEGSKLIVIDAFLSDLRNNQVVRVINNNNYFATTSAEPITNAKVVLNDLTANKSFTFNYTTNGNYIYSITSTDTIAKLNHQYQLNITINGDLYTAIATQKRTGTIFKIQDSLIPASGGIGGSKIDYHSAFLLALDLADNNPDYYWIKTFRNDTLFNNANDLNTCIDGTGGEVFNSQDPFIFFTPPSTFLGFKRYYTNEKCKVQIHSVSKECFNFLNQSVAQITNGGLFATTPENVRTNIITPSNATKAVGWFNFASVIQDSIIIK